MDTQRLKKVERLSLKLISDYFLEQIKDIEEDFGLINILGVRLSPDLSYLDIYVSSFKNWDILCKTLAKYAPELTWKLHRTLTLRKLPKLRFRYDSSWEKSQKILDTINSL